MKHNERKSFSLSESHIITNYIYLNLLLQVLIGLALAGVAAAENTPRYGYSPPPSPPSRTHPPKLTGSSSSSTSTSSLTTTNRRRLVRLQSQRQWNPKRILIIELFKNKI